MFSFFFLFEGIEDWSEDFVPRDVHSNTLMRDWIVAWYSHVRFCFGFFGRRDVLMCLENHLSGQGIVTNTHTRVSTNYALLINFFVVSGLINRVNAHGKNC